LGVVWFSGPLTASFDPRLDRILVAGFFARSDLQPPSTPKGEAQIFRVAPRSWHDSRLTMSPGFLSVFFVLATLGLLVIAPVVALVSTFRLRRRAAGFAGQSGVEGEVSVAAVESEGSHATP